MVPMMVFLVCLASVKSNIQILLPQEEVSRNPRYQRAATSSNPAAHEYIECGSLTENLWFQAVFRNPTVLKTFLNNVFENNLPNVTLSTVKIEAEKENMFSDAKYHTFQDVRAEDAEGNSYIIEMERSCELYDIVRFQYTATRVFADLIDTRYMNLRDAAAKEAVHKTRKAKDEARKAAKKKAEASKKKAGAQKADPMEIEKAMEEAEKAVTNANPKAVNNEHLFKHEDVPAVIVIVIAEKGMPVRQFDKQFTEAGRYTLVSYFDEFGPQSKITFVYIDLKKFAEVSGKLENPETPLDYWCELMWRSRDKKIDKKRLEKLKEVPGIDEAVKIILGKGMATKEMRELEAMQNRDETLTGKGQVEGQVEGRVDVAREMLKKNMDDATIIDLTKISADQLNELKSSL